MSIDGLSARRYRVAPLVVAGVLAMLATSAVRAQSEGPPAEAAERNPTIGRVKTVPLRALEVIEPIKDDLELLAMKHPLGKFLQEARPLVADSVRRAVIDRLAADEAQRNLTTEERRSVDAYVAQMRASMVRAHGTFEAADQHMRAQSGIGFEDRLGRAHRSQLVRILQNDLFSAQVSAVSDAEVEAYYRANIHEFVRPEAIRARTIIAADPEIARKIDGLLAAGTPFEEIAATPDNSHAGLARPERMQEATHPDIYPHLAGVEDGGHTGRVTTADGRLAWYQLVGRIPRRVRTAEQARVVISVNVRREKMVKLYEQYGLKLMATGGYSNLDQMVDRALTTAVKVFVERSTG